MGPSYSKCRFGEVDSLHHVVEPASSPECLVYSSLNFSAGGYCASAMAQYRTFASATGFPLGNPECLNSGDDHPVNWVSWYEAMAYCRWLELELVADAAKWAKSTEAIEYSIENAPYGERLRGTNHLWAEVAETNLRMVGWHTQMVVGKVQFMKLLRDRAQQLGDKSLLKDFMDEFYSIGALPMSLIRWEMTGFDDEIKTLW